VDPVDSVDSVDITGFPRPLAPLLALFIFLPAPAFSSGYFLPGGGAQALGRAGAVAASSQDVSLFWYNPALLVDRPGSRFFLSGGLNFLQLDFLRYPAPQVPENFAAVKNASTPAPFGAIGFSSDFGLEKVVFGLALYTPDGTWNSYPSDGPQRYSEIRSQNLAWYLQATAACEIVEGVGLGAGLSFFFIRINDSYAVSSFSGIFGLPEDRDLDALVQFRAGQDFIPGGVLGIRLRPEKWLSFLEGLVLGFSVTSGFPVRADGRLRIRLPEHIYFDQVTVDPEEPPARLELNFPWMVRFGVRWRWQELFDVELDGVWEGWSVLDAVRNQLKQPTYYRNVPAMGDYRLNDTVSPRGFRDTWSVRGGASLRLLGWLQVHSGFLWEQGAAPDRFFSVNAPDSDKFGPGIGVSLLFQPVRIDMGYLHLFQASRDISVEESRVTQTNPSNPEDSTIVGAGRYSSGLDLFRVGLELRFDDFWRQK
jgi:long-subunit fatty acid transport protein